MRIRRSGCLVASLAVLAGCFGSTGDGDAGADADAGEVVDGAEVGTDLAGDPGAEPGSSDAVDVTGDRPGEAIGDGGPDAPLPPRCGSCTVDGDCGGGSKCLAVGASKHCLSECQDDGDCPRSFICYAASTAIKACLPVSYNCVPCAFDEPCEAGKVCDFVSGQCRDGKTTCDRCTYDFDCAEGLRCWKKTGQPSGACVPECSEAKPCADAVNFACSTTDQGVHLCVPSGEGCGGCSGATPYPEGDGTCHGCLNNSHCAQMEFCDITLSPHVCREIGDCMPPGKECEDDGKCHQCCVDADCLGFSGATGTCTNHVCDGVCDDPCGGCAGGPGCSAPFPVCAVINNVAQCVQCMTDADCTGMDPACTCTGDPTYTCLAPDGNVCAPYVFNGCLADADCAAIDPACTCTGDPEYRCRFPDGGTCIVDVETCPAICSIDADCPPGPSGEVRRCSGPVGGFCLDPAGTCDQMTACCGNGRSCFDLGAFLVAAITDATGESPGDLPIEPTCSCDDTHPCLAGRPCTDTQVLCLPPTLGAILCPGGVRPTGLPIGVCADLQLVVELLAGPSGTP